jgi:hypothetical protein
MCEMPSRRVVLLVLLLVYVSALVPCTRASARVIMPPYYPRSTSSRAPEAPSWTPDGPKPFVLGGVALAGTKSMLNAILVKGVHVSAGVELPPERGLSFVPRVHAVVASGATSGTVTWGRLAADVRRTTGSEPVSEYIELGLGMSALDSPVERYDGLGGGHREQILTGALFTQFLAGVRVGAMNSPGFLLETGMAFGTGAETPVGFELSLGVSF